MNSNHSNIVLIASDLSAQNHLAKLLMEVDTSVQAFNDLASWEAIHLSATNGFAGNSFAANPTAEAPQPAGGHVPHCIVVAGELGSLIAARVIDRVAMAWPGTPLVVACETPLPADVVLAMRSGASNVVFLDSPAETLIAAFSDAAREGGRLSETLAESRRLSGLMELLTPAEHQVLDAMLAGMANKQIAQALQIGLRTVELRRSKIMKKMQAKTLAELVKLICIAKSAKTKAPTVGSF